MDLAGPGYQGGRNVQRPQVRWICANILCKLEGVSIGPCHTTSMSTAALVAYDVFAGVPLSAQLAVVVQVARKIALIMSHVHGASST